MDAIAPHPRTDRVHAYFDRFRSPQDVVRIGKSHALEQLLRVVVSDPVPGNNRRQAKGIERMDLKESEESSATTPSAAFSRH